MGEFVIAIERIVLSGGGIASLCLSQGVPVPDTDAGSGDCGR